MRIGSLCSGYGGLDLAAERVLDARTEWHAEIASPACRVLAQRWPNTPNLGDLTRVDWLTVAPVDVITAGYPCRRRAPATAKPDRATSCCRRPRRKTGARDRTTRGRRDRARAAPTW